MTSTSGASLQYAQALKLLQSGGGNTGASMNGGPSPSPVSPGTAKVDAAIQAILDLLLDTEASRGAPVQGYVKVEGNGQNNTLVGDGSSVLVHGGGGDDRIVVRGRGLDEAWRGAYWPADAYRPAAARWNTGGEGNDVMSIESHDRVHRTYGDGGDDIISIWSPYDTDAEDPGVLMRHAVVHTGGGAGDDTVIITAIGSVFNTEGDTGDDTLMITGGYNRNVTSAAGDVGPSDDTGSFVSSGLVHATDGGEGDDTIEILARKVSHTFGGDGDDTIRINAYTASLTRGGDGDDTIEVTAAGIGSIQGGKGDDTIVLNNTSGSISTIAMRAGDGHDVVTTNSALAITWGGSKSLDMSKASFEWIEADTLRISFEGADDSVTVHFTGDMAGKSFAVDHYGRAAFVIRRNDTEAPWGIIADGFMQTAITTEI